MKSRNAAVLLVSDSAAMIYSRLFRSIRAESITLFRLRVSLSQRVHIVLIMHFIIRPRRFVKQPSVDRTRTISCTRVRQVATRHRAQVIGFAAKERKTSTRERPVAINKPMRKGKKKRHWVISGHLFCRRYLAPRDANKNRSIVAGVCLTPSVRRF